MGDVYDLCSFVLIKDRCGDDSRCGTRENMALCKEVVLEFFRRARELPTQYNLMGLHKTYLRPERPRAHEETYSKEVLFPRSRRLPEERVKTKWELFAEKRGIRKNPTRKGGRVYDFERKAHVSTFGRGSKCDLEQRWIIEVPEHEDGYIDRHSLLKGQKKANVRQNSRNRMLNTKRARKVHEENK